MAIFKLDDRLQFPNPTLSEESGLLAIGGDLSPQRLVQAYASGIFPWFEEDSPDILWWSPKMRMILSPQEFKVSKSLKKRISKDEFIVTIDQAFDHVIRNCSSMKRSDGEGTWILDEMIVAYNKLHQLGLAHSFECWQNNELVGGLYGVSLGNAFFGESMFHYKTDASKVAMYYLCEYAKKNGLTMIDCQMHTDHLQSLGAQEIHRDEFLKRLNESNQHETKQIKWKW